MCRHTQTDGIPDSVVCCLYWWDRNVMFTYSATDRFLDFRSFFQIWTPRFTFNWHTAKRSWQRACVCYLIVRLGSLPRTGHEGLTTTTFYGHRVKQKISFRLNFVMPSSWYDVTSHKGLTTYTSHYLETLPTVRVPTMARDTMGNVQDRPG